MSGPKFSHRAEFALVAGMERLVCALSERTAERVGGALGAAVYSPLGLRRDVVLANLRLAFPEQTPEWIDSVARAAFRHLGREAVAMMRMSTLDAAEIRERTIAPEWDRLETALAAGRGAILATGHFGNWEIGAAAVAARGVPMAAVVRRQGNPLFDARLDALRRSLGVETISQHDAPRLVPRLLRRGGVVGLVSDQDARRAGVFVPFFGRAASTHRGPALFSLGSAHRSSPAPPPACRARSRATRCLAAGRLRAHRRARRRCAAPDGRTRRTPRSGGAPPPGAVLLVPPALEELAAIGTRAG